LTNEITLAITSGILQAAILLNLMVLNFYQGLQRQTKTQFLKAARNIPQPLAVIVTKTLK
jgi:hypothetical protein